MRGMSSTGHHGPTETIPSFHDGHLTSIAVERGAATLGLARSNGEAFELKLEAVEALQANDFREGNIVLDLEVARQSGERMRDNPLEAIESMATVWIRSWGSAMDDVTTACGALAEAVVFLNHFKGMPDPRQRGKVMYPLEEVLLLALLAVLAGAESFVDIARFGRMKRGLLRRFRPFLDGTPSHDHLGDIFAALDAEQFQRCFVAWTASLIGVPEGVVAIDGKTARRSGGKAGKGAIHMVSAASSPASASCSAR